MLAMILLYSFVSVLLQVLMYNRVNGLSLVTEPNKTTLASTGSNQTFTWKLSLTKQEKSRRLRAGFGSWNKEHHLLHNYLIIFDQGPSGKESVWRANQSISKRLCWAGNLTRDYFVAFKLFTVQPRDSGDYGIRIRIDGFPPEAILSWFTLSVQGPPPKSRLPIIKKKSVKYHVVFEKTPLLLECDAEGYPVPWVAWIWNDQVLQNHTDGHTYLLRSNVTMEEGGNYTCMAGNSAGSTKYTFEVIVKVAEPTLNTKATSNVLSTLVDELTGKSKVTSGTPSTEDEPTGQSKLTSSTHSTDPIRQGVQKGPGSTLGVGLGIGLSIGFALGVTATVLFTYLCYYRLKRQKYSHAANLQALCESDDRDGL